MLNARLVLVALNSEFVGKETIVVAEKEAGITCCLTLDGCQRFVFWGCFFCRIWNAFVHTLKEGKVHSCEGNVSFFSGSRFFNFPSLFQVTMMNEFRSFLRCATTKRQEKKKDVLWVSFPKERKRRYAQHTGKEKNDGLLYI